MSKPRAQNHPLVATDRPAFESGDAALNLVDLFAGCGGLTLGVAQAARLSDVALDIVLAVDHEQAASDVYCANFPKANVRTADVEELFDRLSGERLSPREKKLRREVGPVDALVGGPPCQGHSDLNNHTRRDDPKNTLYGVMARAAEVLQPRVVLAENVPAVQHDRHGGRNVLTTVKELLSSQGYQVADTVVGLYELGVAQRRRRHVLLATSAELPAPAEVFDRLGDAAAAHDLRWAIGDLADVEPTGFDAPPRASATNRGRMEWLLEKGKYDLPNALRPPCHQDDHSYKSMYGRLRWDLPAQTITSGFGSIGQGRYMHPSAARALTPHEAARLQGFPDYFDFSAVSRRADLATMIGNAVPPQLGAAVFKHLLNGLLAEPK